MQVRGGHHHFQQETPVTELRRWERRLRLLLVHPTEPCVRLWATVLLEALQDLGSSHDEERWDARTWFTAETDENQPGTFPFICAQLEFNPEQVRTEAFIDAGVGGLGDPTVLG